MLTNIQDLIEELEDRELFNYVKSPKEPGWLLTSGFWSPFYVNLRKLGLHNPLFYDICLDIGLRAETYKNPLLLGIPTAGLSLASVAGIITGHPSTGLRLNSKNHGDKEVLELADYDIVLVDDVYSMGTTLNKILDQDLPFKNNIRELLVVVDRSKTRSTKYDPVNSLINFDDIIDYIWEKIKYGPYKECWEQYESNPYTYKLADEFWETT
jgi:orotate phosphoribosyltransferase